MSGRSRVPHKDRAGEKDGGKGYKVWTEERYLELRVEFFNVWNTPQFVAPDSNVASGTFGRTTSLRNPERPAREIQLGLKPYF